MLISRLLLVLQVWDGKQATGNHGLGIFLCGRILSFSSVSFGISFEHAVQLPFTVFLYSPFPDNYALLSLSPSQIKNIQSADTVPVHGHSPLVLVYPQPLTGTEIYQNNIL